MAENGRKLLFAWVFEQETRSTRENVWVDIYLNGKLTKTFGPYKNDATAEQALDIQLTALRRFFSAFEWLLRAGEGKSS